MIPPPVISRRPRPAIWLADDSPAESELAYRALSPHFEVRLFRDGEALVEALSEAEVLPDAIVLDWVMPGISGVELCNYLRSNPLTRRIPALLLTSNDRPEDVAEGLDAGANDFVVKPFHSLELLARLRALLRTDELLIRAERAESVARALVENVPDALITLGPQQRVVYVNSEATRVLDAAAHTLIGKPIGEVLPGLDTSEIPDVAVETIAIADVHWRGRVYSPVVRPLMMLEGQATTISLRDVTVQRQNEARRLDSYSVIAHELRSPLTAVALRVGLMLKGKGGNPSPEHRSELQKMNLRLGMLDELITDFLELARMDATGFKLQLAPVKVAALVREVVEDFDLIADTAAVTLKLGPTPNVEARADARRLRQVLFNLVSNALKFTGEGGTVSVALTELADELEIRVTDTGVGVPSEAQGQLFRRYVRTEASELIPGTGLGLMIVREIVEAHHGSVGLESEPGKGSSFWVRLPRV